MTKANFDPFDTDDSNDIGEYTAKVVSSMFDVNDDYDTETLMLQWELEITGPEDFPFPTRQLSFTCGKKFESGDGGKTATHQDGKPKGFNSQSRMGILIHRAFHDPDSDRAAPTLGGEKDGEEIDSFNLRGYFTENGFTPFQAEPWVGFEFAFHSEDKNYGGEIGLRQIEMPYAVVGAPGAEPAAKAKPAAKKKTTEAKPATRKRTTKKEEPEAEAVKEDPDPIDWAVIKDMILDAAEETEGLTHDLLITIGADLLNRSGITEETPGATHIIEWLDNPTAAWAEFEE